MYRGVPLMEVSTIVLLDMALAKPKSQSLTVPPEPIKMFCAGHREVASAARFVHVVHDDDKRSFDQITADLITQGLKHVKTSALCPDKQFAYYRWSQTHIQVFMALCWSCGCCGWCI